MNADIDESWPMIEQAVFGLFDELADKSGTDEHVSIGPRLADLGWSEIEAEYPIEACELLFRAQGRSLAHTDCLERVMLGELAPLLQDAADGVVLPQLGAGYAPGSDEDRVTGIVLGPLTGRLLVPVSGPMGTVSVAVVDADHLRGERLAPSTRRCIGRVSTGNSTRRWPRRPPNGIERSPRRTGRWPPNWSRSPTRRCESRCNT